MINEEGAPSTGAQRVEPSEGEAYGSERML